MNPVLNGVNVLLAYLLVLGLYDRATARLVLLLLCAFLLAIPLVLRAPAWLRTVFLAANLVVIGFTYNVQLSLRHLAELSQGLIPTPANLLLFVLVVGVLALGVAFGPVYCAWLCPFGAAQELVFGADRAAGLERAHQDPGGRRRCGQYQYGQDHDGG